MSNKKKNIAQTIEEVEIFNRRTRKYRKIYPFKKEIIVYNDELNEFQLLSVISSSYDENSEPKHE
jgi:hypothetical protein